MGRPMMPAKMRELCKAQTVPALKKLARLMEDDEQPGNVQLQAATALLDRAWGKPQQQIDVDVEHKTTFVDVLRRAAVLEAEDEAAKAKLIDVEVTDIEPEEA